MFVNIVGFVGVVVTQNDKSGVFVEPSAVVPPGAIFGFLTPADSTSPTFQSTFSVPRLTKPGG
jgi:hypothetical protein